MRFCVEFLISGALQAVLELTKKERPRMDAPLENRDERPLEEVLQSELDLEVCL